MQVMIPLVNVFLLNFSKSAFKIIIMDLIEVAM